MEQESTPAPASRLDLALAALAIGVLTVVVVAAALSIANGQRLNLAEEYPGLLAQVAMVTTPFFLLALLNIRARRPWLLGVALTVAVWGYYLFEGLRHQLGGDQAGVNIGLAMAMLASPIIITLACLVAALVGRTAPAPAPPPSAS